MSTLTQLIGGSNGPVASIVNRYSSGSTNSGTAISRSPGRDIASGALTANTLATVLSVTGRGRLNFVSARSANATSRTIRIQITLDGTVVFNATSSAITSANIGIIAIGSGTDADGFDYQAVDFNESCLVQIASSLTETDNITANLAYEVWS